MLDDNQQRAGLIVTLLVPGVHLANAARHTVGKCTNLLVNRTLVSYVHHDLDCKGGDPYIEVPAQQCSDFLERHQPPKPHQRV